MPASSNRCSGHFQESFLNLNGSFLNVLNFLDIFLRRRTLSINQNHNEILEILQHLEKSANVFHFFSKWMPEFYKKRFNCETWAELRYILDDKKGMTMIVLAKSRSGLRARVC